MVLRLTFGVVVVALTSTIFGVGMTAVSSWLLHKSLQMRKNPTLVTATDLLHQVNTFFGGTTGLYDLDVIFRILISCSATALAGGALQFISTLPLLLCGTTGKTRRFWSMCWLVIQFCVMLAVSGAFLCILTNELEMNTHIRVFLIVAGLDVLLIIANIIILLVTGFQQGDSGNGSLRTMNGVRYANVPTVSCPPKEVELEEMPRRIHLESEGVGVKRKQMNGVKVLPHVHLTVAPKYQPTQV